MSTSEQTSDARARKEADFHDARINTPEESRLGYAYVSVADVYEFGKPDPGMNVSSVLELGCFRGDQALRMGGFAGSYVGIDISPAAVEHCKALGLPQQFRFAVDDANVLATIADDSVDYAFGHGVLHHLDLERFAAALNRKLRPGGVARFVEPAQGNFALRAFRRLTPRLRTPDEKPFDDESMAILERHVELRVRHHALLRPFLPMLLANRPWATRLARWLDDRLLRLGPLQGQAWLLQIELRKRS